MVFSVNVIEICDSPLDVNAFFKNLRILLSLNRTTNKKRIVRVRINTSNNCLIVSIACR